MEVSKKKTQSEKIDCMNKKNIELHNGGDTRAIARLYSDNYDFMKKVFYAKTNYNSDLSEDLAQDTMMKMISYLDKYQSTDTKFRTWLMTLANSVFIDHVRKNKLSETTDSIDFSSTGFQGEEEDGDGGFRYNCFDIGSLDSIAKDIDRKEKIELVTIAINSLSNTNQRRAMRKLMEGKSYAEISDEMGENLGTLKGLIFRAKEELRKNKLLFECVE